MPPSAQAVDLPEGFGEVTVAEGFNFPTAAEWTPDGTLLVIEKAGRLWSVSGWGTEPRLVLDISDHVNAHVERGLLGLAVDKDYTDNRYVYLLYNHDAGGPVDGPKTARLTRIELNEDEDGVQGPEVVLLGKEVPSDPNAPCPPPSNGSDCLPADSPHHTIGTVISDPVDGTLWVGAGDGADWSTVNSVAFRTYDEQSYSGKVLHIDRSGRGLPNHPFCPSDDDLSHVCTKVFAKGFRNPYRFALRSNGVPLVADVGSDGYEEINLAKRGANYGWPCYEGPVRTPGYRFDEGCAPIYEQEGTQHSPTPPDYSYPRGGQDAAVVGGPEHRDGRYPSAYAGSAFFGDYARGWIKRLLFDAHGQPAGTADFATGLSSIVDLRLSPEGELTYVTAFGEDGRGAVRVISHQPGPVARASADPLWGAVLPLQVEFTGSRSADPAGGGLTYHWEFGDGAESTEADPVHEYTTPGPYTATLTITDENEETSSKSITLWPGNTPPEVEVIEPLSGATYRSGPDQVVRLAADATDAEDDADGKELDYSWQVLLRHDGHLHDHGTLEGRESSFSPGDDHDANSHYEITLRVTDSQELETVERIQIYPETVELRFESVPPGASISYGSRPLVAPATIRTAVGFRTTIGADESLVAQGATWRFDRWSIGGPRLQEFIVGPSDASLQVVYSHCGDCSDEPGPPRLAPPPPIAPLGPPPDTVAPSIRRYRMLRSVFAVGARSTAPRSAARVKRGTAFMYRLSEPATVRIELRQVTHGLRLNGRCRGRSSRLMEKVRQGRRLSRCALPGPSGVRIGGRCRASSPRVMRRARAQRRASLRRCALRGPRGSLGRSADRGANRTPFTGRIGRRPLPRGHYIATITARDRAGNVSKPRSVLFRVVRRR